MCCGPSASKLAPIIMPSAQHLISYHLVTAGQCWAVPQQGEPARLEAGDVIVFPGGDPHVMCSNPKVARGEALDMQKIKPGVQWPYQIVGEKRGPNLTTHTEWNASYNDLGQLETTTESTRLLGRDDPAVMARSDRES